MRLTAVVEHFTAAAEVRVTDNTTGMETGGNELAVERDRRDADASVRHSMENEIADKIREKGTYDFYDIGRCDGNSNVFILINNIPEKTAEEKKDPKKESVSEAFAKCMEADATKLTNAFRDLSFGTRQYINNEGKEIEDAMKSAGNDSCRRSCFVSAVLSKSDVLGEVYDINRRRVPIDKLVHPIRNSMALAGRPKIFFFISYSNVTFDDLTAEDGDRTKRVLPSDADLLYVFLPGCRQEEAKEGSIYVEILCQMLTKSTNSEDFVRMLGTLRRAAVDEYPSVKPFPAPCMMSMLTRGLCFKPTVNGDRADGGRLKAVKYDMNDSTTTATGTVFIINNKNFTAGYRPRHGTEHDVNALTQTFQRFGFNIILSENRSAENMLLDMAAVCQQNVTENDKCFVAVLMSHGEQGDQVIGFDGRPCAISNLIDEVCKCTHLKGKPKILIVQACRGSKIDPGTGNKDTVTEEISYAGATPADCLLAFASTPGRIAFLHNILGSVFIQALCTQLDFHCDDTLDLVSQLTIVNKVMAEVFVAHEHCEDKSSIVKQMPSIKSTLTKEIHLKPLNDFKPTVLKRVNVNVNMQVVIPISNARYDHGDNIRGPADVTDGVEATDSAAAGGGGGAAAAAADTADDVVDCITDDGDDRYEMTSGEKYLYIINNMKFDKPHFLPNREGSDVDAKNIVQDFDRLGFVPVVRTNLKAVEMLELMILVAQGLNESKVEIDCLAVAVLSHGDMDIVYGTDEGVKIDNLVDPIKNCTALNGKPKLFIFQACRGSRYNVGLEAQGAGDSGPSLSLPIGADCLYAYSTAPWYFSYRNNEGSWFIKDLHEMFQKSFDQRIAKIDFVKLLTRVSGVVALRKSNNPDPSQSGMKQIPSFVSMLTKDLIFEYRPN